ncbi:uncharacterized protein N0V89_008533 [Didymosphaeria variabile]|uniref:Uncharacterized protein n=1 Tax=Didymosphaeria variabile TaxID=1932322 RepID=A0A9W9C8X2_9PLEO|nr:uncharacterized protein N0V89_008533 [Didymosphaeria variabile]KAJ4349913.1 hypothetical protein N0V89_008533 [Didymosphaeria variabile]
MLLFEEIRSQWEAAHISHDEEQPRMVGRKEKPAPHHALYGDETTNASKFRRKLNQGLSLISLSQRRTTPVRPLLPSNDLNSAIEVPHPHESTRLLSPMRYPSSYGVAIRKVTPGKMVSSQRNLDAEATRKQIPRSRTMGFITRPSQNNLESFVLGIDSVPTPGPPFTLEEEARVTPTKIPSPDSSTPEHTNSSPRQYHSTPTTQQAKHVAAGDAFAAAKKPSPVRSYTTPNLVKTAHPRGPNGFVSPRKLHQHKLSGIPGPQRPKLKENSTPVTHRHVKRLSNILEHSPKSPGREGLMAPTVSSRGHSTGPVACTTPPASSKRKNSQNVIPTPFTAQRALPKKRSPFRPIDALPVPNEGAVTQTRLLGPVSPRTLKKDDHAAARLPLPRANTEKNFSKRTFPTPKKRIGGGMLARSQAVVNNEVRFPRSSTYHHFLGVEDVPPVPPIPEQYKSTSMPMLVLAGKPMEKTIAYPDETNVQEQGSGEMISPSSDSPVTALPLIASLSDRQEAIIMKEAQGSKKSLLAEKNPKLSIQIPASGRSFSASLLSSAKSSRLWSAKDPQVLDVADIGVSPKVKDYMPALYWAGRFQARYDQWRTEAIQVELDREYHMDGPLAHCNVHQEKAAACHIFLQLRDLCLSNQAADSLWEFEHKYRHDHNLLGTSCDLPPLNPKPDDGKQGSLGRAIRKMTPRKSSFVNLLKGKGWNTDEVRSTCGSIDCDSTVTKVFESSKESHLG